MKKIFTIAALFSLLGASAVAQKSELRNAKNSYAQFQELQQQADSQEQSLKKLKESQTAIDKASQHEKTKNEAETFSLRSLVYAALSAVDTTDSKLVDHYVEEAKEAIVKAKELDKVGDNKESISVAEKNLSNFIQNKGVNSYQKADFESAYKSFSYLAKIHSDDKDTLFNYYAALAAKNSKKYKEAATHFGAAVENGSRNTLLFAEYARTCLILQDTVCAMNTIEKGMAVSPNDMGLIYEKINIYIARGKIAEMSNDLQRAIDKELTNKTLHFVLAVSYERANKMNAAEEEYKKALEIDPSYFEPSFNLGAIYVNRSNEILKKANNLPNTKQGQIEYEKQMLVFKQTLELALPHLEKAFEVNPKDRQTVTSLQEIYIRLEKKDKAEQMKRLLKTL